MECFKAGRHVAMSGAAHEFAQSDLAATAGAYDPALHEAPIVIGHPRLDGPAHGWVAGLRLEGTSLEATPRKVDPAFAAAVESGAYGKVSAAFFAPDSPTNPVPGVYYLRHIGFLGATPPAVKGLRDPTLAITDPAAAYAELEPGVVVFSEWSDVENASLWRSLRDWILGKFGAEDADRAVPSYQVQALDREAQEDLRKAREETQSDVAALPGAAFAQPSPQESTVTEAEKAALEAENARLRKQIADQAEATRKQRLDAAHADAVAFADGLVAGVQIASTERELVVGAFDALAAAAETAGEVLQFAQGETKVPIVPALKALLAKLPKRVHLGRVATPDTAAFAAGADVQPNLAGGTDERRKAIAGMFPDLPTGTAG